MDVSSAAVSLPQNMDLMAATALRETLVSRRGAPLTIDAGGVQRFGGLCLQVLLAAKREWDQAGLRFELKDCSRDFEESLRLMGARGALGLTT